tara:strand:- start:563 stop:712 length:150 start_codon:yes stop_codon:yes gene_type:complete
MKRYITLALWRKAFLVKISLSHLGAGSAVLRKVFKNKDLQEFNLFSLFL